MKKALEKKEDRLEQINSPSWYDLFTDLIDKMKLPSWLIYLIMPVLWVLLGILVQRLVGSGTIRDWHPISFVAIFQIGYVLFINQFLDKLALKALDDFKPALNIEEERFRKLQRLISTLPARRTALVTLLFGLIGLFLTIASMGGLNLDSEISLERGPLGIFTGITFILLWLMNGLFVYHTYHQLNVVNYIYTDLATVHPFHQRELFAFSRFSASTSIAIIMMFPAWIIFDPGTVNFFLAIPFTAIAFIAFISPLVGVHRILEMEKENLLDENGKQMEKVIETLMDEIKKEKPESLSIADQKITTLEKARSQIERISTWPWRIETLRQIVAAIFLPITIWLLQYLLAQLLGG